MSVVKIDEAVSKDQAGVISKEIQIAVEQILKKHNLKISKQSVKYGTGFDYKVSAVAVKLVNGVNVTSIEAQEWVTNAGWAYDVANAEDALGAEFVSGGVNYRLAGCKINKTTKPILILDIKTGKEYYASKNILNAITSIEYLGRPVRVVSA